MGRNGGNLLEMPFYKCAPGPGEEVDLSEFSMATVSRTLLVANRDTWAEGFGLWA